MTVVIKPGLIINITELTFGKAWDGKICTTES